MITIRLSGFAVLAATALLFSTSCASPTGVPWGSAGADGCSPACGPGLTCVGNNQCVPSNTANKGGSGGSGNQGSGGGSQGTGTGGSSNVGKTGTGGGTSSSGNNGGGSNQGTGGGTQTGSGGSSSSSGGSSSSGSGGGTSSSGGTNYCGSCSTDADCGGGNNFCLGFSFGNYCGTDCSSGQSCPAGAVCHQITDSNGNPVGKNCIPSGTDCSGNSTGGSSSGGSGGGSGFGGSGGGGFGGGSSSGGSSSTGGTSGGGSCTTDTWSSFGSSFFQSYCAQCHGNMSSQSGVQSQLSTIASSIQSGRMPPGGLSSSVQSRIIKYLNCGAP